MSKGDAEHAAQHQHGVQVKPEPAAPQTLEQRVAALEKLIAQLVMKAELPITFEE